MARYNDTNKFRIVEDLDDGTWEMLCEHRCLFDVEAESAEHAIETARRRGYMGANLYAQPLYRYVPGIASDPDNN